MITNTERAKPRLLLVDDDRSLQLAYKFLFKSQYQCFSAYNGDEAMAILQNQKMDVVLLDLHMRAHEEGLHYLPKFKAADPEIDVIILSGNTELNLASRCTEAGASSYLLKGCPEDQIIITIESVLKRRALLSENRAYQKILQRTLHQNQIVGTSQQVQSLLRKIEKLQKTDVNVLISGESGTGKELVAKHIARAEQKPLITVDSATITSSMAESILFGHEKGSFTGAIGQSSGLFEEANGGSIFFDEIANMPLDIQSKLLRVIQEKEVMRVGSTRVIPLDFRVISATNRSLEKMAETGQFKFDLLQRLNVIEIRLPTLRERKEDLPLLVDHFIQKHARENSPTTVSDQAMNALMAYHWPGNIRELSNLLANLCSMLAGETCIELGDLPPKILFSGDLPETSSPTLPLMATPIPLIALPGGYNDTAADISTGGDFYRQVHALEGELLTKYYKEFEGNISEMSRVLKISRSHLYSKLRAHHLHN